MQIHYNAWQLEFKRPFGALQAGNNYTYTVKVRNKVLEVSEATIAKWNDINGGEVDAGL